MYSNYQNIINLYNSLLNRESEFDKKKNKLSDIISLFFEISLFSFELITKEISDKLTTYNISEGFQVSLFIILGVIIIPILSKGIIYVVFKSLFIFSKYKLFKRNTDKDMYVCFYQYIFPICSNINQINKKQMYNMLSKSDIACLTKISTEINKVLNNYKKVYDMYAVQDCSKSYKRERIIISDYDFCLNVLETFLKKRYGGETCI